MRVSLRSKLDKKMIVSLTGFMGCGKSSTGRELAARLDARFIDLEPDVQLDVLRRTTY